MFQTFESKDVCEPVAVVEKRLVRRMVSNRCTFCELVEGNLPVREVYVDEHIFVFHNQLNWAPVMLLIIPKVHMTQEEVWNNEKLMGRIGLKAVELGNEYCPNGFRLLANFGSDALQSQCHGHVHMIGGTKLGLYVGLDHP